MKILLPSVGRDPHEAHRTATPLELLFDLVFVVAISVAAADLHHGVSHGDIELLLSFVMTFVVIWWAWMNFTWYASAFDNNDIYHRFMTLVVMAGALVFAAGIPQFMHTGNSGIAVFGYVIMRVGMVALWLRTAKDEPRWRNVAYFWAGGIAFAQVLWIARYWVPAQWNLPTFIICFAIELLIPILAEKKNPIPYHLHHIVERYGLFTIIVLGEGLVGIMATVNASLEGHVGLDFILTMVGGLVLIFVSWWWYFNIDQLVIASREKAHLLFRYGHVIVFTALASYGPLIEVAVDILQHNSHISTSVFMLCVSTCTASYFIFTAFMYYISCGEKVGLCVTAIGLIAMLVVSFTISNVGVAFMAVGIIAVLQLVLAVCFSKETLKHIS